MAIQVLGVEVGYENPVLVDVRACGIELSFDPLPYNSAGVPYDGISGTSARINGPQWESDMYLNETISPIFTVSGTPDEWPTAVVRKNTAVVVGGNVTVTPLGDGQYRVDFTAGDGWAVRDFYSVTLSATVGGVAVSDSVSGRIRPALVAELATYGAAKTSEVADVKTVVDAIKTVTDKFLFDASNFVKSAAQSLAGYVAPLTGLETVTASAAALDAYGAAKTTDIPDLAETQEKLGYIYDLYHVLPTDRPPLPPMTDPSTPGMVTLRVVLRDGTTLRPNEQVTVAMLEKGNVSIDGAHEVDKTYSGTTNQHGVADIPVFASTRLDEKGYNGLYSVVAPGVRRNVWVPAGGGLLDDLPKSKPTS